MFSTGDEVVSPGVPRGAAQLFDSNRFMLMAMLRAARLRGQRSRHFARRARVACEWLQQVAGTHDLILTSGGVSTGEEDHVKAGSRKRRQLVLWRMAIKPGRPVAMGIIDGTPLIGLPGNPVASFVTFVHVVRPTVLALAGACQAAALPMPVRAAFTYRKKLGRREYVRASLRRTEDGALEAIKFPREGAGLLSSLVETDGLVELDEEHHARSSRARASGLLSYESFCDGGATRSGFDIVPWRPRLTPCLSLAICTMATTTLDLTGLKCPLPALKTRKALKRLQPGDLLEVHCTDPLSVIDIPHLMQQTGDRLELTRRAETQTVFVIEKVGGMLV